MTKERVIWLLAGGLFGSISIGLEFGLSAGLIAVAWLCILTGILGEWKNDAD